MSGGLLLLGERQVSLGVDNLSFFYYSRIFVVCLLRNFVDMAVQFVGSDATGLT